MISSVYFPLHQIRRVCALMLCLALLAGCGVNNIPTYEENAKAKWSQVLNQYKRRSDLIPNLIETVKGFAAHEKDVLTAVVEARAKATSVQVSPDMLTNGDAVKGFLENQGALGGALSRLLVTVERYPELKSSQNFLALQSQLEGTENRISVARRDYIEAVRLYNTELKTIPGRWWRSWLYAGNDPMATFDVAPEETATPKVNFDSN
ncbi:MAG: LemA family protein [Rhizobiaceae bacterium]|nr:LemA family protein [Rhizobiaceae bacterium]